MTIITIPALDPVLHTPENDYHCANRLCPCWDADFERVAQEDATWQAFQDVPSYCERFAGEKQPEITYLDTLVENALVFERSNGEQVNFTVQHFGTDRNLVVAVYDADEEIELDGEIHLIEAESISTIGAREQVTLSYQEARLLRDLLNRREVQCWIEQEE